MRRSIILDEARLQEVVAHFLTQPGFSFDLEAVGEHRGVVHLNDVTWLSMATKGACVVIPFGHPIGTRVIGEHKDPRLCADGKTRNYTVLDYEPPPPQIPRANVFEIIRPLFFDEGITKSAHGAVFDIASSAKYFGEVMPGPYNCTIVQDWLLNENRLRYGLKHRVKEAYGFDYDDENVGRCVEKYPFGKVAHYSYCDALYAELFRRRYTPLIEAEGLQQVYQLEMDVLNVLVGMRLAGAHVDMPRLRELREELAVLRDDRQQAVWTAAGCTFNLNSPPQKQAVLFGPVDPPDGEISSFSHVKGQGLAPWKATDTGKKQLRRGEACTNWSTDDEVLSGFPSNPVCVALREYGDVHKLLSTYVMAYLGNPAKDKPPQVYNDRIHADFVQYGTNTRRFSCRAPNLQNIPRPSTPLGKLIRGAWCADPGWKLVVGDYGQIELVMFAHYAGHGALFDGFWAGVDPHQVTADQVGIERQQGKTLNFSMSFGAGIYLVASMLGVDVDVAKGILADHREAFPELYELRDEIIATCRSREPVPYVHTLLGGIRRLPEINYYAPRSASDERRKEVNGIRMRAERQAVSAVIQGSAADLIKLAMVRADSGIAEVPGAHLILTVHDEIVLTAPEEYAEQAKTILETAMLGPEIQKLIRVPLTADVKIVDRWADAK
jgi:DNA polymerase I-like protein with 3'-5' exonuclease and polymerase domains